jgi:hypothetical protein
MHSADAYRQRAVDLEALMSRETDPATKVEWLYMAKAYRRLAELAEHNALGHIIYERQSKSEGERYIYSHVTAGKSNG